MPAKKGKKRTSPKRKDATGISAKRWIQSGECGSMIFKRCGANRTLKSGKTVLRYVGVDDKGNVLWLSPKRAKKGAKKATKKAAKKGGKK
tara:strand:+ start:519 stop:788 length:270 start_codon:yes stop_codon:yes gene_type:complete